MEKKIAKAHKRLKEFAEFSPNFETFKSIFFDNLKDKEAGFELVLMSVFAMLKSEGERYNELLSRISKEQKESLQKWLDEQLKSLKK